jgi:hypothetical protein
MKQAAHGWGVSRSQAYRIVQKAERLAGRRMRQRGKIRTADFLAIPKGDLAASPMIPDVAILWAKLEALEEQQQRIMRRIGGMWRHINSARQGP